MLSTSHQWWIKWHKRSKLKCVSSCCVSHQTYRLHECRIRGTTPRIIWDGPEWSESLNCFAFLTTFPNKRPPLITYFRAVAPKKENSTGAACLRSAGISASRIRWSSRCSLFFTRPTPSSPSDGNVTWSPSRTRIHAAAIDSSPSASSRAYPLRLRNRVHRPSAFERRLVFIPTPNVREFECSSFPAVIWSSQMYRLTCWSSGQAPLGLSSLTLWSWAT